MVKMDNFLRVMPYFFGVILISCGTLRPPSELVDIQTENKSVKKPSFFPSLPVTDDSTTTNQTDTALNQKDNSKSKGNTDNNHKSTPENTVAGITTSDTKKATSRDDEHKGNKKDEYVLPALEINQHVQRGISLLEVGEEAKAKLHFEAVLKKDGSNQIAGNMLEQINNDPTKYLGAKSFSYTVKTRESLSTIARDYLDDPLKFHALAKYNKIANPADLKVGQVIKVPGEKRGVEENVNEEIEIKLSMARKMFDSGDYEGAAGLLERLREDKNNRDKVDPLLIQSYSKRAEEYIDRGDFAQAQTVLEKGVSSTNNRKLENQLVSVKKLRMSERFYLDGVEAAENNDLEKAYLSFEKALANNPKNTVAKAKLESMKTAMADVLHKKAMQSYRRQKLKEAINEWDKVLELDNQHELAKLYRARAVELQSKIEHID